MKSKKINTTEQNRIQRRRTSLNYYRKYKKLYDETQENKYKEYMELALENKDLKGNRK